jgi:hypothetical protein
LIFCRKWHSQRVGLLFSSIVRGQSSAYALRLFGGLAARITATAGICSGLVGVSTAPGITPGRDSNPRKASRRPERPRTRPARSRRRDRPSGQVLICATPLILSDPLAIGERRPRRICSPGLLPRFFKWGRGPFPQKRRTRLAKPGGLPLVRWRDRAGRSYIIDAWRTCQPTQHRPADHFRRRAAQARRFGWRRHDSRGKKAFAYAAGSVRAPRRRHR